MQTHAIGPHPAKPFGVLPFHVHCDAWTVGVRVGSERNGWTGMQHGDCPDELWE